MLLKVKIKFCSKYFMSLWSDQYKFGYTTEHS